MWQLSRDLDKESPSWANSELLTSATPIKASLPSSWDKGPEANKSYESLIKDIEEAGGPKYKYLNIDPSMNEDGGQPDANIRVGFLYNPKRQS